MPLRPLSTMLRRALGTRLRVNGLTVIGLIVIGSLGGTVLAGTVLAGTGLAGSGAPPVTSDAGTVVTNPFIPDVNLGECVSSLPRPGCGTDQQSGYHQYLTFIILLLATIFIGWRIARGVRSRDRAQSPPPDKPTTKTP